MDEVIKDQILDFFNSEDLTISFDHWYNKGEWFDVSIARKADGAFFNVTGCDAISTRACFVPKKGEKAISVVVDIEKLNNIGCDIIFRCIDNFTVEIR